MSGETDGNQRGSAAVSAPEDGQPLATRAVTVEGRSERHMQDAIDSLSSGGIVYLPHGEYIIERPVVLRSNIALVGAGPAFTKIVLAPGSGCHMFTNPDKGPHTENIELRGFTMDGNMATQHKHSDVKSITFAMGTYFKRVRGLVITDIEAVRIRQTAVHFNHCDGVRITNLKAIDMGWSGVSTSGSNDVVLLDVVIENAGLDVNHSGIHLDGGSGAYVEALVDGCTGNAIMLDSHFGSFTNAVIKAVGRRSNRGLSLSGVHDKELSNVFITGEFSDNRDCGILVSNASNVFIVDAVIASNGQSGITLQGRAGARHCVIADCRISHNPTAVKQLGTECSNIHQTRNLVTSSPVAEAPIADAPGPPPDQAPTASVTTRQRLTAIRRRIERPSP